MIRADGHNPPLLDASVLSLLRADLDSDEGVWKVFIENFVAQLPRRVERLRQTMTSGDAEGAMDAVLSLRTSSQMVGAERLAGLALHLERSLRADEAHERPATVLPRLAAAHLRGIQRCAQQTSQLLKAHLKKPI